MDRTIFYNQPDAHSHIRVDFIEPDVRFAIHSSGEWETTNISAVCPPNNILKGIANARLGGKATIESRSGSDYVVLSQKNIKVCQHYGPLNYMAIEWPYNPLNFDAFFLDIFSVLENSEPRKRTGRDIELGSAEKTIIDIVSKTPSILFNFTPRLFEVFIGSLLANLGFSNIKLSRFSKDGGIDLYAIYFEGNIKNVVVIEVKHFSKRKVGLAIVDRLNGVRDSIGASRGVIFTTSSFTLDAQRRYKTCSSKISLIDYDRLVGLLESASGHWHVTPSGLWTLPRREEESLDSFNIKSKHDDEQSAQPVGPVDQG